MLNCSQLNRKNNTHKHNSCIIPLLIKNQLWLQFIFWVGLILSIQCSLQLCRHLSAEIFLQNFQKSVVTECYNYIHLLTTDLQAEFHEILSFTQILVFYLFFLDLFFSEVSTIITAATACSSIILLELLKAEYFAKTTFVNLV